MIGKRGGSIGKFGFLTSKYKSPVGFRSFIHESFKIQDVVEQSTNVLVRRGSDISDINVATGCLVSMYIFRARVSDPSNNRTITIRWKGEFESFGPALTVEIKDIERPLEAFAGTDRAQIAFVGVGSQTTWIYKALTVVEADKIISIPKFYSKTLTEL